jgi:hypothetical protein
MNERSIFLEALDKEDPTQRSAFLDTACAGDDALRQRVEALLKSHIDAGSFLGKLAPQRLAEELASQQTADESQPETPRNTAADEDLGFLTPADKPDLVGRLGHYDIQEVIGRGGMGIVLKAFDGKLHRVIAIKVMAPQLATSPSARRRFAREAQAAAAVRNDHVTSIYAVEEARELPYLVMEYISGESLQQRLDRSGPLQLREILRIGLQTANGLAAAHAQGLVHRDIKPANILLENGVERVKITDFGLARAVDDASLSQSGVVAGTPPYMAPEQARGEPVDHRADLFSLGSVLYAMATGQAPFRAAGAMAVLKRVSDEPARPVRELTPELPDWLAAIIARLHAKDPAQRYQSAEEVAELLGQHLAHLQQPAVAPKSDAPMPTTKGGRRRIARRWAMAAAVLLLVLGALAATETTGVTNLRATVIRIFTPDGTLVVETDDPGVRVTIEGDGGLVITGAGLEEIRLRPGSYKVHADRDGKRVPLERELVSISRGGREVVKVKLENSPAPGAAQAAKGAFVVLAAGQERKFDSLAEAVLVASDGDTVEIRGNGPYLVEAIQVDDRALILRAGQGFRPKLQSSSKFEALLTSNGPLVLEGIEFGRRSAEGAPGEKPFASLINSRESVLHVANCRFIEKPGEPSSSVHSYRCARVAFRNSDFLHLGPRGGPGIIFSCPPTGTLLFENCVGAGLEGHLNFSLEAGPVQQVSVLLRHNTWATTNVVFIAPGSAPLTPPQQPRLSIEAAHNVFDSRDRFLHYRPLGPNAAAPPPRPWADMVRETLEWRDEASLYPAKISLRAGPDPWPPPVLVEGIAAWDRFWKRPPPGSLTGRPKFQGGDLYSIAKAPSERLKPDDFRLRPDSPGYRAGKDGKDLGADVELVGPGAGYERWKKTPEYQQWLKDSGQVKGK